MPSRPKNIPQVDPELIFHKAEEAPHTLEPHEIRWLQDYGTLPEGIEPQPVTFYTHEGNVVSSDPNWFQHQQTGDITQSPQFQAHVERRARELMEQRMAAEEGGGSPDPNARPDGGDWSDTEPPPMPRGFVSDGPGQSPDLEEEDKGFPNDRNYDEWNVNQLTLACLDRDLDVAGRKVVLIERLRDWDKAHDEEDDETEEE